MTLKLSIDVPDRLAEQARSAGLLKSSALIAWLREELRRRRAKPFGSVLTKLAARPGRALSDEEIEAEIAAVRTERRERAANRR